MNAKHTPDTGHSPPISFIRGVIKWAWYLLSFAFVGWFVVVFMAPMLFGFAGRAVPYMEYIKHIENIEANSAKQLAPEVAWHGTIYLDEGWTYKSAKTAANRLISPELSGISVEQHRHDEDLETERTNRMAEDQQVNHPADTDGWKGVLAKLGSYFEDQFWPIFRIWITITLTRGWLTVEAAVIIFPWLITAWFYGVYLVRRGDEQGLQPLGNRYQFWSKLGWLFLVLVPSLIVLPIPIAWVYILPFLVIPLPFILACARANTVQRL